MVNWKSAAVLGVVLLALLVYAVQSRGPSSPATSSAGALLPCTPGEALELRIAGSDGRLTDASRPTPSDPWRLVGPVPGPADGTAIEGLLAALADVRPTDTLRAPPAASTLGLDPPATAVTCTLRGGRSYTLSIGGQNFDGSGAYARVGDAAKVYVIPSATATKFRDALDKPPVPTPSPSGGPGPSPST